MKPRSRQQGVIFLVMVLVLVVAGSAFAIGALNNRQTTLLAQRKDVYEQMEKAKQLLLAYVKYSYEYYSAQSGIVPGLLPCPNTDGSDDEDRDRDSESYDHEANETPSLHTNHFDDCVQSTSPADYIGRLPEYITMPIDDYPGDVDRFYIDGTYAGIGQQFWYAVSPNFLQSTVNGVLPLHTAQGGTLTLDGAEDIVALIIAPGEQLQDQNREQDPTDPTQYLDGGNGTGLDFWTSYEANPDNPASDRMPAELFNDTVLAITRTELWEATQITTETYSEIVWPLIVARLQAYYSSCNYYPKTFRNTSCSISLGVTSAATGFRNLMNAASNPNTWIKESASGGDGWVSASGVTYTRFSDSNVTVSFRQYDSTACLRYSLTAGGGPSGPTTVDPC